MIGTNYINELTSYSLGGSKYQGLQNQADQLSQLSEAEKKQVQASKEFEEVFISQLYKIMFETVEVDSVFGGGFAEETFRGFLVDEYGKITSEAGGIGVSEQIQKELISMQMQGANSNRNI